MAGLYIHVPFCAKRCIYCDFYSNTDMRYKDGYVAALVREMQARCNYLDGEEILTIYFGGGTPSQLKINDFKIIFDNIYKIYNVSSAAEITVEANPDDLSDSYVAGLCRLPFNRISIGVQSFSDDDLKFLNRRHSAADAVNAVERCRDAGLANISIDLMYGLPSQTIECWCNNVEQALALQVPHISAYCLTYEENTVIRKMLDDGKISQIDDDTCEHLYNVLVEQLEASDYIHYEISNFAKKTAAFPEGRISKHNSSYWDGTYYLGLGPAAHSYNGESRSWNASSIKQYVTAGNEKDWYFPYEIEILNDKQKYNDFVITRLRTMRGLSLYELERLFGNARKNTFLLQAEKYFCLKMLKKEGDLVKINPQKLFVSDTIIRDLIA